MRELVAAGRSGRLLLDDEATAESVSAECRSAALSFMSGAATGWDKLDLALWLAGPYATAVRHGMRGQRVASFSCGPVLPESEIERLVTRVRSQVLAALENAALDGGALGFVADIGRRGLIHRAVDRAGGDIWIPLDVLRMRLRDRVESLLAADYMNAPVAYSELMVCHLCEGIVFDATAKQLGICCHHKRDGGVVPRFEDAGGAPVDPTGKVLSSA